jgi:hypothetical protein
MVATETTETTMKMTIATGDYVDEDYFPCTGALTRLSTSSRNPKINSWPLLKQVYSRCRDCSHWKGLEEYKELVDGDYGTDFATYERYVEEQVPIQINTYVGDNGNKYFQCKETKERQCCNDCTYIFCHEDCSDSSSCTDGLSTKVINCPTNLSDEDIGIGAKVPNAIYIMKIRIVSLKISSKNTALRRTGSRLAGGRSGTPLDASMQTTSTSVSRRRALIGTTTLTKAILTCLTP